MTLLSRLRRRAAIVRARPFRTYWWFIGSTPLTLAFWAVFLAFCVGIGLSTILPLGDYPYHVALAGALKRLFLRFPRETAIYESNVFSYNSSFHVATAIVGIFTGTARAGIVTLIAIQLLLVYGFRRMVAAFGQGSARTVAILPVLFSVPFIWGFVNFLAGVGFQMIALARVVERPRLAVKARTDVMTAFVVFLGAWSHLMATAIFGVLAFGILLIRMAHDHSSVVKRIARTFHEGLVYVPAFVYVLAVYFTQEKSSGGAFVSGTVERERTASVKLTSFFPWIANLNDEGLDAGPAKFAAFALVVCLLFRDPRGTPKSAERAFLLVAVTFAYLLTPDVFWSTAVLDMRFPMLVFLAFALWVPRSLPAVERTATWVVPGCGAALVAGFVSFRLHILPECRDLQALIRIAPPSRVAASRTFDTSFPFLGRNWAQGLVQFYVAYRGGQTAVSYATLRSLPIRYKPGAARFPSSEYDVSQREVDLVFVRMLPQGGDPRGLLWSPPLSTQVQLIGQRGVWWLYSVPPH